MWPGSLYLQQEENKRKVSNWSFVQKYSEFKIPGFSDFVYHLVLKKSREHTISENGSVSVLW
jgi:hypothetical protein